jgi:hypothetical protein
VARCDTESSHFAGREPVVWNAWLERKYIVGSDWSICVWV